MLFLLCLDEVLHSPLVRLNRNWRVYCHCQDRKDERCLSWWHKAMDNQIVALTLPNRMCRTIVEWLDVSSRGIWLHWRYYLANGHGISGSLGTPPRIWVPTFGQNLPPPWCMTTFTAGWVYTSSILSSQSTCSKYGNSATFTPSHFTTFHNICRFGCSSYTLRMAWSMLS